MSTASHLKRAASFFRKGAAAYNRGDDESAVAEFTQGLAVDPDSAPAYLFRALSRLRLSRLGLSHLEDAIVDLSHCLDRDPVCVDALWARARAHYENKQLPDAVRDLSRVLAFRTDDVKAVSLRGEIRQFLGDWSGCVADYRRAVELAPGDARVLNRLAWVLATCPVDELRNGVHAVKLAEQANQLAGQSDPLIWDTLAAAYAEAGRFDDAVCAAENTGPECANHRAAFAAKQPWRDPIPKPGP